MPTGAGIIFFRHALTASAHSRQYASTPPRRRPVAMTVPLVSSATDDMTT